MTAERQEANSWRPGLAFIALLACFQFVIFGIQDGPEFVAKASTTERVIANRYSGLAIEGYDPVAYFVDARPVIGVPEFEAAQTGVVWRFRNEGNRASFIAHPEVYGPQFGGYDPIDIARGVTYAGNPRFWLVSGQRLYLFGREESRAAFAADPEGALSRASTRWPTIVQNLSQ